ncbi:MAG: hypothetical protein LKCHEGNO_01040 [Burkholderiaceae bacterium]|nr:hypothetical protein [Burkholderiaceae bacterium]
MDLSDLSSTGDAGKSAPIPASGAAPLGDAAWQVTNQVGAEVARALTPALDSVRQMQLSGRIDRVGLHALISQIEQARHASTLGQQIARLAQGGIAQQPEALSLSQALRDGLAQRQDELNARGLALQLTLKPADVVVDATLLSALLDTMLDWSLRHACTPIDVALDVKAWPAHARIACRFGHTPSDQAPAPADRYREARLDCLSWRLLGQLARSMALSFDRCDTAVDTALTLEFPHTVNGSLEGASAIEWGAPAGTSAQPLAGTHALVIALRREVLNQIRHALLPLGVVVHCVGSVDAAREFCQRALPRAIVYESTVYDSAFDALRSDIKLQCPDLAWVEIIEQGEAFEISSFGGMSMARVGSDAIAHSLPSALMFELARGL